MSVKTTNLQTSISRKVSDSLWDSSVGFSLRETVLNSTKFELKESISSSILFPTRFTLDFSIKDRIVDHAVAKLWKPI